MTMVVMLGVLAMLVKLAADSKTWRWLAPDAAEPEVAERAVPAAASALPDVAPAAGPTERDPQEQDAAREEFQVLTDKTALAKEEMPAYWRLMAWQEHQTTAELLKHAATNVTYNDLFQQPDQWRGKLVRLRVHLQQTVQADNLPENPVGLTSLYEVWGWNTDSQPYTYWFVVPRLPPGMPSGPRIVEEATFVGYFLKLLKYEDRQGITRATPLLVGRLIWHPTPSGRVARIDEWQWVWYLAGLFLVWFVARRGLALWGRGKRPVRAPDDKDPQQLEAWLDSAENAPTRLSGNGHDADAPAYRERRSEITGPPPPDE